MDEILYDSLNNEIKTKEADVMTDKVNVLDKGYVRLADVMGSDHSIASAARVSYDKETEELTKGDIRLIRFLAREGHCYDSETEVLTSEGFVSWGEINNNHKLAAVDPRTSTLKGFEKPLDLVEENYVGGVVSLETPDVSLKVTEGHSLYASLTGSVEKRSDPDYSLIPANKKVSTTNGTSDKFVWEKPMRMKKVPSKTYGYVEADPLFKLYGFFIGDGHAGTRNTISFHLKKQRKIDYLKDVAKSAGFVVREGAGDKYTITREELGEQFRDMFYEGKKKTFPSSFFKVSEGEYEGLKEGLLNSDGYSRRGVPTYDTSSSLLADRIQTIATIFGDVVSVSENAEGLLRLNFNSRRVNPRVNDTDFNRMRFSEESLTVYCATVTTGLLVIRRNGKTLLCGNTSPFRHAFATFEIYAPLMVARQLYKYVVGADHTMDAWNESSRRYITEEPTFYVPQSDEWRSKPANSKQGSGDNLPFDLGEGLTHELLEHVERSEQLYEWAMENGVAPEQARLFLPAYGMYVRWRWSASLQSIAHFLNQRLEHDSQYEIQQYAKAVLELIRPHFEHSIAELVEGE